MAEGRGESGGSALDIGHPPKGFRRAFFLDGKGLLGYHTTLV